MSDEKKSSKHSAKTLFVKWLPWVIVVAVLGGVAYGLGGCAMFTPTPEEVAAGHAVEATSALPQTPEEQGLVGVVSLYAPYLAPLALLFFRRVRQNAVNVAIKAADLGKAVAAIPGLVHTDAAKEGVEKKEV
jgi:hypothetical protein